MQNTDPNTNRDRSVDQTAQKPPAQTAVVVCALPRIAIHYCPQCKWMLRAAYYAQEILSTFGSVVGEVALVPAARGQFAIIVHHQQHQQQQDQHPATGVLETRVWDRTLDGGFPEVKLLKARVRDIVEPSRSLGHTDRALGLAGESRAPPAAPSCDECV